MPYQSIWAVCPLNLSIYVVITSKSKFAKIFLCLPYCIYIICAKHVPIPFETIYVWMYVRCPKLSPKWRYHLNGHSYLCYSLEKSHQIKNCNFLNSMMNSTTKAFIKTSILQLQFAYNHLNKKILGQTLRVQGNSDIG